MRRIHIIFLLLALPLFSLEGKAQIDAIRAFVVTTASKKSKKHLENNEKAQLMMTAGHIFMKEEEKEVVAYQKELNEFLDSVKVTIAMAVEIYGIYNEVSKTAKNLKELNNIVLNAPDNALATAFSTRRNKFYRKLMCFGQTKMTKAEREILFKQVRPKMHKLNKTIVATSIVIKYTTFNDVWKEITNRVDGYGIDKKSIAEQCFASWRIAGKNSY